MKLTPKDKKFMAAAAIVLVPVFIFFLFELFWLTGLNPIHQRAKEEYRQLHGALTLDMTKDEVRAVIAAQHPKYLDLWDDERIAGTYSLPVDRSVWMVTTPGQMGALNWIMHLYFEKDRLIEIHSGSGDEYNVAIDAPSDKLLPGAKPVERPRYKI